ncbi:MAG TPA: MarR family winged helix-turn-helix transcriptional regulator [Candidatus Acidoferrales bacterium]|nr:MarR family winged helix-turn-helix transcriptional regulator [Candidatus Acidoferrales bacterium]
MIAVDKNLIPPAILGDSILVHLAAAYFAVSKSLERKTHCSQTRGFILSTLRGGAALNQNQIATMLGFDRTVVHRAVRAMIREGLASERKAPAGKALLVRLTPKGNRYRENLVRERRSAEEKLRAAFSRAQRRALLRSLQQIAQFEF